MDVPRLRQYAGLARDLATKPATRRSWLLWARHPANLFQPFGDTQEDRYPAVFELLRQRFAGSDGVQVLSFGCSTGEEVFTLRRYLPEAELLGVDISRGNIADARRRLSRRPDPRISFEVAASTAGFAGGRFDAVLCMAVLRHGDLAEHPSPRCDHRISFQQFERAVTDFDRCLRPGGLLAIEYSNFRFADTAVAGGYSCVLAFERGPVPRTPLYGPDNRLLPDQAYGQVVFEKVA